MGGLAGTAAKLLASLELDTRPFEAGARRAGRAVGALEQRFGKIGGMAQRGISNVATNLTRIGVVAAGAIGVAVRSGIQSLAELERANQQTAAVIESTGGQAGVSAVQVRELAESLERLTTADDKAIQSGENLLLTFTNIGADTFPAATKAMVDLSIAMAQGDVANADFKASAIQIGKALNDPVRGFTALRRVGVSFTKDQEKRIKDFVKEGKVIEAQKVILGELEKEFGKAGEAAGKGFGGDLRRFDDALEDSRMALATGFLPVIRKVADALTTKLADPAVQADIRRFGDTLAGAFDKVLEAGAKIPWAQIGDALKLGGQGAKAIFDAFTSLPPWVQTAVLTGWGLNKLSGGMLGSIVGELGKGLIKGVLGMTAGVVNINAGVVNGGPGVPGGRGVSPVAGTGLLAGGLLPITIAAIAPLALVELTKAMLGGPEKIAERDLAGRQETAAARGLDPSRVPVTGGHRGFNAAAEAAKSAAEAADHSRDATEAAKDIAFRVSRRSLRIWGETETKRGQVDWKAISDAQKDTNARLDKQRATLEQQRTAVERVKASVDWGAMKTATATSTAAQTLTGALANQSLRAAIPVNVYVNGVPVKSFEGATWLQRSTSGGNIRGGAD